MSTFIRQVWLHILFMVCALGLLLIYLISSLPYSPRFYLPGILLKIFEAPNDRVKHDWLMTTKKLVKKVNNDALPNIILIVADDLGINDLSGGAGVLTPNIDSIFTNGVRFTKGYASHATCAPSRAAIMTGRFPTRFGFEFTPIPKHMAIALTGTSKHQIEGMATHTPIIYKESMKNVPFYRNMVVPSNETFVSQVLQKGPNQYVTYMLGKWHL